jgi:type IV pilus assembly protein PilB
VPPSALTGRRRRLGELLVESALISEDQLKAALLEQKKWGGRLGKTLVEMGFVTESSMVAMLASQLQLRSVDLDAAKLNARVTDHLRLDLAERYGVFPLGVEGNTMCLATSDPTNLEQIQELEFATNKKVQVAVATASSIDRSIRKYYFGEANEAMQTIHPRNMGVAVYELDDRTPPAAGQPPSAPRPPAMPPPPPPPSQPVAVATPAPPPVESALRKEIAVLKEQVDALETISASQVKALRGLLEILIESGLVTRDEYVERLHARDDER